MGVLNWDRVQLSFDVFNTEAQRIAIGGGIGVGERLRRTVVDISLTLANPINVVVDDALAFGTTWGIEATQGIPPPTPTLWTDTVLSDHDILHIGHEAGSLIQGVNSGIFYIRWPAFGSSMHADTPVNRGDGSAPVQLWIQWSHSLWWQPSATTHTRVGLQASLLIEQL